jgi:dihydrofolate synthase/folylpolyglutamate synthase
MSRTLADWLAWIERVHPRSIELGLERVHAVLDRLGLRQPGYGAITVTGTNGKGSTCAMIERCLRAAGYKVGFYSSPHLVRYNERVRVNGREATDDELSTAFARIEAARGEIPLTYFEFGTLAAFEQFARDGIEVAVLEVGMGGRLDAVNAVDADVAIVTTVDLDHMAWLGKTREAIGYEKAGIFRAGRPAVCGDTDPPESLIEHATRIGARLHVIGRDFGFAREEGGWRFRFGDKLRPGLPFPALRGDYQLANASCALAALEALADRFPVTQAQVRDGLLSAVIPGRFQVLPGRPLRVLDVAHNPQAARALAMTLRQQPVAGRTLAVFAMLRDKDIAACAQAMSPLVDGWHVAGLSAERGATAEELVQALASAGVRAPVQAHADVSAAYVAALAEANEADRIVVFGSFHTVGDILARAA